MFSVRCFFIAIALSVIVVVPTHQIVTYSKLTVETLKNV